MRGGLFVFTAFLLWKSTSLLPLTLETGPRSGLVSSTIGIKRLWAMKMGSLLLLGSSLGHHRLKLAFPFPIFFPAVVVLPSFLYLRGLQL